MLLETALADFSSDDSRVLGQPGAIPFSWEVMPGKPRSPPLSECSGEVSTASSPDVTIRHKQQHRHEQKHGELPSPSSTDSQTVRHYSGELYTHPHREHSGELHPAKSLHRQYSGELLPHSQSRQRQQSRLARSPAQLDSRDLFQGSSSKQHHSSADQHRRERGSSSSGSKGRTQSDPDARYHRRVLSIEPDENLLYGNMSFEGDASGTIPFEWETLPGRPKSPLDAAPAAYRASGSSSCRNGGGADTPNKQVQLPPARLVTVRESDQAECSNSSTSPNGSLSPDGRMQQQQYLRKQQGRSSGPLSTSGGSTPQHMRLKVYPGDIIRISRRGSFQSSTDHNLRDSHCSVDIEVEKFYEDESPVSTLEHLPSPTGGHLNGDNLSHRGSSPADTSRRGSAVRPNSSASASPIAETRISADSSPCSSSREGVGAGGRALRCLPSFHSASLHSSAPPASNSSSSTFMASCLVALEVALHSDREAEDAEDEEDLEEDDDVVDGDNSDRHDGSFVSLDEAGGHVDLREPRFSRGSPARGHHAREGRSPELRRRGSFSHRWAVSHSQLEPEYHTMDFFSENGDEGSYKLSSVSASSRSYSADRASTGATSSPQSQDEVYRLRDRHQQQQQQHSSDPRSSLDEYSWRDKRFLQDHPRTWADEHPDDIISENMSSDYNLSMAGRHQEVYWDDQQSDMNSERAEEVVRGAVDGLRFTYSPVSSAFVFTRPPNSSPFENDELPENRVACFSPPNTVDTEISQRFSISLDYATSICSEDSLPYSIARSSDVTELGLSRAESWSRVQRGASFAAAAQQQQYPSGLVDRRVGYGVVLEDSAEFYETPENDHLTGDHSERLVRKRSTKKSGFPPCLPFRSILRNFKAFSPGRSRLGSQCPQCELHKHKPSPTSWAPAHQTAVKSH